MRRKTRDYAPPSPVPRLPSPVPRLPSPVPRLPSPVPRPPSPAHSEAYAPVPSSLVPPPKRPSRRQCRSAASRTAGTIDRRWQPTGDPRPPSQRPGQGPGRGRSPFLVSAADGGGKKLNHFSRRRARREKSLSRSDARKGSGPLRGPDPFRAQAERTYQCAARSMTGRRRVSSLKCSSVHLSEITWRCIPPSWPCRSRSSPAWRPPQRGRAC